MSQNFITKIITDHVGLVQQPAAHNFSSSIPNNTSSRNVCEHESANTHSAASVSMMNGLVID